MFRMTLQTIRARKARLVLTAMAVILGVAFMAGTLVLTDTIKKAYDGIAATKLASTDAVVQSARSITDAGPGAARGTLPDSVVSLVRQVEGVAGADGVVDGAARLVDRDGKLLDDSREQATPIGMAWPSSDALNPLQIVAGRAPSADDEVVIDRASSRDGAFAPGDSVRVLTPSGSARYTVSGVATYGSDDDAGGASVVAFTPATAARVLGDPGRVDSVRAVAATGISQSELVARIRDALDASGQHRGVEVVTGRQAIAADQDAAHEGLAFMSTFLVVFAVVALIVGGFVIFNAFSITVAQRAKETAMLRAIGSSRRQVKRMIVVEAAILGVVASAIGAVVGVVLAIGLAELFTSFGVELPSGATVVTPRALGVAIVIGVLVTVLAAYLPARRASKVAPVAAMRGIAADTSGASRRRSAIGTVLTGVGVALVVVGSNASAAGPVAGGALAVFAGVVVLGPVLAPRFVRIVGAPVAGLHGVTGTLARDNAARNPKRTAATASALMIGVALVVLMSVFASSVRSSIDANIDQHLRSDWVITPLQVQDGLSPTIARAVDDLPETASVTTFTFAPATLDGATAAVTAIEPATVEDHLDIGVRAGSVGALGAHGIGVRRQTAQENGWHVGDEVEVTFAETGAQRFRVALLYELQEPLGDYVISRQAFDENVAHVTDQGMFVLDAPGVSERDARAAIRGVLGATPSARLHTPAEFKADTAARIDELLNLIYVLLVLGVVIALFGIANALALSVVERRRELGLLRAVGMHRRQLRATIRWEAVLIALLGAVIGTALGVGFGWALVQALASEGIDQLAIPGTRLVLVVVIAALAAVLAAALPARRAARLDVLAAIGG